MIELQNNVSILKCFNLVETKKRDVTPSLFRSKPPLLALIYKSTLRFHECL